MMTTIQAFCLREKQASEALANLSEVINDWVSQQGEVVGISVSHSLTTYQAIDTLVFCATAIVVIQKEENSATSS